MPRHQQLRVRDFFRFYGPLVLTSQMMTLATPLINLHLSRAPEAKVQLAAYAVGFGVLVFLNAPLLVVPNVTAGLFSGRASYARLRALTVITGLAVGLFDILLATTGLGTWVFESALDCTSRVADEAKMVVLVQSPIPILVGLRGLRFGLAMRGRATGLITQATVARLLSLVAYLALAVSMGWRDARSGALALTVGIAAEGAWIWWTTRKLLRRELGSAPIETEGLSYSRATSFALPLIVSAYTWTVLRPLINGILGRTGDSEVAQAAFGVIHPLILLTASALWALQATGQVLATDRIKARRFLILGGSVTIVCSALVMALTRLAAPQTWLLTRVFTLSEELRGYIQPAMAWIFVAPIFLGARCAFKGMILASGSTGIISLSAATYLAVVTVVGIGSIGIWPTLNGALLGTFLVICVEIVESAILGTTALRRFGMTKGLGKNAEPPSDTSLPLEEPI